jgi:phosphohistidine phosphatase SixA
MPRSFFALLTLVATVTLLPDQPAYAAATPAQKCIAVKLDATARALAAHVACQARALQKNTAVRAGCHESADRRLDTAFARIEARGACAFTGDEGAVDTAVDALVDALVAGQTPGKCGATKLRLAAQKAFVELGCHRVGVRHGEPPAVPCLTKAVTRFLAAFARADARLACGTTGDAPAVQAILDAFVTQTTARLIDGSGAVEPKPTNLAASIDGADVDLTWTAPQAASGNTHVRVLRRLDAAPVDAADADATVVFFGTATTASHALTDILPTTETTPRTYHYAAFGCTAGGACEAVGSRTTLAPTVRQALLGGGYTIYFRHASATVCVDQTALGTAATTMSPDWWKSCDANCATTATARQLDATGAAQATTIGQAFDSVGIPVGRVIASEFCRTRTTADLMDFGPPVETDQGITFFVYEEASRCMSANALLAEIPTTGNTAIVGHGGFVCDVLGQIGMGEAAIFKPVSGSPTVFIARVLPDDWATLP